MYNAHHLSFFCTTRFFHHADLLIPFFTIDSFVDVTYSYLYPLIAFVCSTVAAAYI